MKIKIAALALLFFTNILLFQNCGSNVQFEVSEGALTKSPDNTGDDTSGDTDSTGNGGTPTTPPSTPGIPNIPPPNTPPNTNVQFNCKSYVELTQVNFVVPAKDVTAGLCYYVKLMDAVSIHRSGSLGEKRVVDVLSADHNGDQNDYIEPFLMGDKDIHFTLKDTWKMAISRSYSDPKQNMAIDNFYLLEIASNTFTYKWAYGTADAEPGTVNKRPILVDNKAIDSFYAFAPSGTAQVQAIDLTGYTLRDQVIDFRFRSLDCGGQATATDTYLVFY